MKPYTHNPRYNQSPLNPLICGRVHVSLILIKFFITK
uniref:Uncharacterized protein MANES_06G042900 n=1 Tax=Rhizophora mucronata TaxID=61149 RepID=A0A2P2NHG1_RHIMU